MLFIVLETIEETSPDVQEKSIVIEIKSEEESKGHPVSSAINQQQQQHQHQLQQQQQQQLQQQQQQQQTTSTTIENTPKPSVASTNTSESIMKKKAGDIFLLYFY